MTQILNSFQDFFPWKIIESELFIKVAKSHDFIENLLTFEIEPYDLPILNTKALV